MTHHVAYMVILPNTAKGIAMRKFRSEVSFWYKTDVNNNATPPVSKTAETWFLCFRFPLALLFLTSHLHGDIEIFFLLNSTYSRRVMKPLLYFTLHVWINLHTFPLSRELWAISIVRWSIMITTRALITEALQFCYWLVALNALDNVSVHFI